MRDAHGFDGGCDRTRVHERHVLADAAERNVRAKRFSVEGDLATRQFGANSLAQSEYGWRARADPEPNDARLAAGWEAPGMIDLDVERGNAARGCLDRGRHVRQPLVRRWPEEGERHVHQLRFHAT